MKQLFQITVADEQGVVVDTGWVAMEVPLVPAGATQDLPVAGAALFDAVLVHGIDQGIEATPEDAVAAS
jgi:hypothetical protein